MRRAVIAGAFIVTLGITGLACTKVVVITSDPATADEGLAVSGATVDVGAACEGRAVAWVEFAATMGKGRARAACGAPRAAMASPDAGGPPPDAAPAFDGAADTDAAALPDLSRVAGTIAGDATSQLPTRPVPADCAARYGGRRGRPVNCPDCSPRLITTVDLACQTTTIRIEADGDSLTATCTRMACAVCEQRVLAFVGAGAAAASCEEENRDKP